MGEAIRDTIVYIMNKLRTRTLCLLRGHTVHSPEMKGHLAWLHHGLLGAIQHVSCK